MSNEEIIQITVAGVKVGINGLKPAIEAAKDLQGRPDEEIAQFLFSTLEGKNYIPTSVQEEYQQAFLREYKKAMGEKVAEERRGLNIKILGPDVLPATPWNRWLWRWWLNLVCRLKSSTLLMSKKSPDWASLPRRH